MRNDYTVEIFKTDRRCHRGERMIAKFDFVNVTKDGLEKEMAKQYGSEKFRYAIFETMVTKKNILTGVEFKERYDTPYYCSPSSETYFSM